jgi:hypothetical protein
MDMSLSYDLQPVQPLFADRREDESWQRVFRIIEDITVDKAAELFLSMEKKAQTFINTYKLRALFCWAIQTANCSVENLDVCAKRAEAMSLVIDRASQLARSRARGPDRIPCAERAKDLDAAAKSAHTIACTLDKKIMKDNQVSMVDVSRTFADGIVQSWYQGELNPYLLELTSEEAEGLKNFFFLNELITRCYALSSQLSPDAWKEIQQQMVQPFTENNRGQIFSDNG